jgi:hypothetical protein
VADEFDRSVLFAAYRMAQVPATSRRDRVLERLCEPDDRPVFLPDPRPVVLPGVPLRVVLLAAAAAVLAVLGLELLSGGIAVRFDRQPADQAVDVPKSGSEPAKAIEREEHVALPPRRDARMDAPVAASAVVIPPPPVVAASAQTASPVPVKSPSPARRKSTGEPSAEPPAEVVAVQEPTRVLTPREIEASMIADALAALDRDAWSEATAALTKHAKEFPKGEFRLERDALRIVVRCERDHSEAARIQARDFIVSTALSPHWQRIIDSCKAKAPPPTVDPFQDTTAQR